jgi:ABC-type bacteriocin/lantibiotic exporter with double-glycine peptidase domain
MSDGALVFINSSVGSISQAELPCLVFTNKNWFVLSQNKESLQITNDGEEFRIISDFTELVPGIALWVKERRSQKHEYSEQTKTAFSFILSSALRDKKWLFDIVAATIFVNVFFCCGRFVCDASL